MERRNPMKRDPSRARLPAARSPTLTRRSAMRGDSVRSDAGAIASERMRMQRRSTRSVRERRSIQALPAGSTRETPSIARHRIAMPDAGPTATGRRPAICPTLFPEQSFLPAFRIVSYPWTVMSRAVACRCVRRSRQAISRRPILPFEYARVHDHTRQAMVAYRATIACRRALRARNENACRPA